MKYLIPNQQRNIKTQNLYNCSQIIFKFLILKLPRFSKFKSFNFKYARIYKNLSHKLITFITKSMS